MKHKCTMCGTEYESDAAEILNGCTCGNKRFFFLKDKMQVPGFVEIEEDDTIIALDTETVNIIEEGKYEIDLDNLLRTGITVYKYGEGKYSIDIPK